MGSGLGQQLRVQNTVTLVGTIPAFCFFVLSFSRSLACYSLFPAFSFPLSLVPLFPAFLRFAFSLQIELMFASGVRIVRMGGSMNRRLLPLFIEPALQTDACQ